MKTIGSSHDPLIFYFYYLGLSLLLNLLVAAKSTVGYVMLLVRQNISIEMKNIFSASVGFET